MKLDDDKFDSHKKTAEMDKVLIISWKPRGSLDAMQERSQDLN